METQTKCTFTFAHLSDFPHLSLDFSINHYKLSCKFLKRQFSVLWCFLLEEDISIANWLCYIPAICIASSDEFQKNCLKLETYIVPGFESAYFSAIIREISTKIPNKLG